MAQSIYIPVEEQHQEGEARRMAASWAMDRGFNEDQRSKLSLVVAELARNLALHTTSGGFLLLRQFEIPYKGVEILCLDRGPGMANFAMCLRDGYSSAGTSGKGLGAVVRASEKFDVHSQPSVGTAFMCDLFLENPQKPASSRTGLVNVAKKGETVSGDAYGFHELPGGRARMIVADGLGHGPLAAEASNLAIRVFQDGHNMDLVPLLERMNLALKATRGAAVAIAEVSFGQEKVRYAGVGNISGAIATRDKCAHLVSHNGTVGGSFHKPREFVYDWSPESMLIMNSDGVKGHWRLERYAGLQEKHPALAAAILFRDFNRGTDDSTVATLRS